jgi:hypothetical protein
MRAIGVWSSTRRGSSAGKAGIATEGRKGFFFEKKKQKTFATAPLPATRHIGSRAYSNKQKFFGSFF